MSERPILVAGLGCRRDCSLGELLACPHCLALWLAIAPAVWLAPGWGVGLLLWLAVAGGASALELALNRGELP